jgi:chitinase
MKQQHRKQSVYRRVVRLGPLFPWLLFVPLFQYQQHQLNLLLGAAEAATIRGGGSEKYDINRSKAASSSSSSSSSAASSKKNIVRRELRTVQNYCGKDWGSANSECKRPCPDGNNDLCAWGEQCFADLTSCPSMTIEVSVGAAAATYDAPTTTINYEQQQQSYSSTSTTTATTTTTTLIYPGKANTPPHCSPSTTDIINVGYFQSWAKYRQPDCYPLKPSDINVKAFGYTHLVYSFAGISLFGKLEPYNGIMDEVNLYREFNDLKKHPDNQGLKTFIAVGGWTFDQTRFTKVASTPESRQLFAQSVAEFCLQYQFDGIDFDWEYPVTRDGVPEDFVNYPLLIQEIRSVFAQVKQNKGIDLLLTMAVPVNPEKLSDGYDLQSLTPNVDWYNLMAYDIHGHWDSVTGSHTDMEYIQMTVEYMIDKGVTGDKMALGLASYGRSMRLTDHVSSGCSTEGCPISGAGVEGCNGEMGFSPLFDLMQKYVDTGMYDSLLLNEKTGSMEMIVEDGNVFVTFDLEQSFQIKREYYLSK